MTRRRSRLVFGILAGTVISAGIAAAAETKPIGFYAPWDAASVASLRQHGDQLGAVVPAWISVTGADHRVTVAPDPAGHAAISALPSHPKLWLMVQNALLGSWDGTGAASLLPDPTATASLLDRIEQEGVAAKAGGVVVDLESLPPGTQPDFLAFLAAARERCRHHGWTLAVTVPVANPDWNIGAVARVADRIILMAYDEHWQAGRPGPIASNPWFASVVKGALAQIPPRRAVVAIASYAYDWPANGSATILSIAQAEALAQRNGVRPQTDPTSGSAHFRYVADDVAHDVWMSDAATVRAQIAIAHAAGAQNIALWRLGTEDGAIWR